MAGVDRRALRRPRDRRRTVRRRRRGDRLHARRRGAEEPAAAGRAQDQRGDRHHRLAGAGSRRCARSLQSAGIGVLAASNFSLGMNVFQLAVEEASRHFAPHAEFGAWIHEAHHAMKKDAPSGTALMLKSGMEARRLRAADRRVVDARRLDSRHAHGRLRRSVGDDRVDAHRARPRGVRARRAGGGEVAGGQQRLVLDARHVRRGIG